ncbi:MAG: TonB family protein [Hyphomonadaceae bacterium]|nr:TonB family protein [Hyphomonadaceae bacterium]
MLVSATRTLSALATRAIFYAALFLVVAIVHVAITTALRTSGWNGGAALLVSGGAVLGVVLVLVNLADFIGERRAAARELQRLKQGLPSGPCCVVWRGGGDGREDAEMAWRPAAPMRARYPKLARRLGVEGVALVEFEINAQGRAKGINCLDVWPSNVFFEAAREALEHTQFELSGDVHPRFGESFRMPFVFRIEGATRIRDRGRRARPLRPALSAAANAVNKMRSNA